MLLDKLYVGNQERKIDKKGRLHLGSFVNNQILDSSSIKKEIFLRSPCFQDLEFFLYRLQIGNEMSGIVLSDSPNLEVDVDYKLVFYKSVRQDKASRINLHDKISQEILGEQSEVVIVGNLDRFEVYSKDVWQQYIEKQQSNKKSLEKEFHSAY
jgi:DNA-binding transcriptional regulator/RsmH inhibitor MraZ